MAPLVLPVVLTTHGEFCPGAIELQEWLVEKYRLRLLLEGPRDDGEEPEHLTACFRRELRASLLVAMIHGTSAILNAAGLPKGFKRAAAITRSSRPAPPSPTSGQDVLEDGEIVDSDGGDESDSANSSTSGSDDSVDGTPSVPPRRSARIAQQSGVEQQPPTRLYGICSLLP